MDKASFGTIYLEHQIQTNLMVYNGLYWKLGCTDRTTRRIAVHQHYKGLETNSFIESVQIDMKVVFFCLSGQNRKQGTDLQVYVMCECRYIIRSSSMFIIFRSCTMSFKQSSSHQINFSYDPNRDCMVIFRSILL